MSSPEHDFVLVSAKDLTEPDLSQEDISQIRSWLSPTDYTAAGGEYSRHLSSYTPGTDFWTTDASYRDWLESTDRGTLWIRAVPGAGKSVAAARLISQLSGEGVPVLFFFFRQIITSNRTPESLLRDWMAQLLDHSPTLPRVLHRHVKKRRSFDSLSFDEMWLELTKALCALPKAYCVADALDEMSFGNDDLIERLLKLGDLKPDSLKVCVTSRPVPRIEKLLRVPTVTRLDMNASSTEPAILGYIRYRLRSLDLSSDIQVIVERELVKRSEGLFLYVKLMMDELLKAPVPNPELLDDRIRSLPFGLSSMYTRMLDDYSTRTQVPQRLQIEILRWVTHSARPLRIIELAAIIDFLVQTGVFEDVPKLRAASSNSKAMIRVACGPLIEILEDETVSIIHHSLTEYIVDSSRSDSTFISLSDGSFPTIDSLSSHREMAIACVRYLCTDWAKVWRAQWPHSDALPAERACLYAQHPFLHYASQNWSHHCRHAPVKDGSLSRELDNFLKLHLHSFEAWRLLTLSRYKRPKSLNAATTMLHVAAAEGLGSYIEYYINQKAGSVEAVDGESQTPLHHAAKKNFTDAVSVLLQYKADPNPSDKEGLTPLHLAAQRGSADVISILLEAGVDASTPKTKESGPYLTHGGPENPTLGKTPVEYTFEAGHLEAALAFASYLDRSRLLQAVHWAAREGHSGLVNRFVQDYDMDFERPVLGRTLVYLAAFNHDPELLKRLKSMGADFTRMQSNIWDDSDRKRMCTLAHGFASGCTGKSLDTETARMRSIEVLEILAKSGCRLDVQDDQGHLPLHLTLSHLGAGWGRKVHADIVSAFLELGANPSATNGAGEQPMHLVDGDAETVGVLIKHGADIDARNADNGETPLHTTLRGSKEGGVETLLSFGADCDAADNDGNTPLHVAAQGSYLSVDERVELFLKHEANPNARNKMRETPLHKLARADEPVETLRLLCEAGADIEARTLTGKTVLMEQCKKLGKPSIEFLKAMIAQGARLDSRDYQGRTVLHQLCEDEEAASLIGQLVGLGADPHAVDFAGNNMFHHLALRRQQYPFHRAERQLYDTVLDLGVNPSASNHHGQTPIHVAAGMRSMGSDARGVDALDYLLSLGTGKGTDVNAVDHNGVAPVHVASTLDDRRVKYLLEKGADPYRLTFDGQSLLHIAARAREANTVGLVANLFGNAHPLINHRDYTGRTALYHACRSGRIESVRILLDAGARVDVLDHQDRTPLHACAEFAEELQLWRMGGTDRGQKRALDAGGMILGDDERPRTKERRLSSFYQDPLPLIHTELGGQEEAGLAVRYIVRLLLEAGASVSAPPFKWKDHVINSMMYPRPVSPMVYAVGRGCAPIVDELRTIVFGSNTNDEKDKTHERALAKLKDFKDSRFGPLRLQYLERYLTQPLTSSLSMQIGVTEPGQPQDKEMDRTLSIWQLSDGLIRTENEQAVIQLFDIQGSSLAPSNLDETLSDLVKQGYASLISKIPKVTIHEVGMATAESERGKKRYIMPLLFLACERHEPNLDVIKVLVEEKGVELRPRSAPPSRPTAVHVLAHSSHWWKAHAIAYMADQGVSLDVKDSGGDTPLHIALEHWAEGNVDVLLERGANPNLVNEKGETCLSMAKYSPHTVRQLLKFGADVKLGDCPFIFDAIDMMDLGVVADVLSKGGDPTAPSVGDRSARAGVASGRLHAVQDDDVKRVYPIHLAASRCYNEPTRRAKMIPIIELLLAEGADPFKEVRAGKPILHSLCEHEGILAPFLSDPKLDLESRDGEGNTLLLSACLHRQKPDSYHGNDCICEARTRLLKSEPPLIQQLTERGADTLARNHKGQNALHRLFAVTSKEKQPELLEQDFRYLASLSCYGDLLLQTDEEGKTVLHYVLRDPGFLKFATDLLNAGAEPSAVDNEGNTALHYLSRHFDFKKLKDDDDDDDAADRLRFKQTTDLFIRFLSLDIPINANNTAHQTPLHVAVQHNALSPSSLAFFLTHGAYVHAKDKEGQGLLHVLAARPVKHSYYDQKQENEKVRVLWEALVKEGLKPEEEDKGGRSAVDLAVASGVAGVLGLGRKEGGGR